MSDIPTWHERAMRHPDHQSGMISEGMIRARMAEEIADLRAEVEQLTRELNEARAALKASSCAYPDCVDLGPDGKCTKWLLGKCDPTLEAKP